MASGGKVIGRKAVTVPIGQPSFLATPWCSASQGMTPSRLRTISAIEIPYSARPRVELSEPKDQATGCVSGDSPHRPEGGH